MESQKTFFKLFTNCVVTKGSNRSLILDLHQDSFITIPNSLQELIECFQSKNSIGDVYEIYGNEHNEIIDEYVQFLIDNELGFITDSDEYDFFIDMDLVFDIPTNCSNCILEMSELNQLNISKILDGLSKINCHNLQIIFYDDVDLSDLIPILDSTNKLNLKSIEIVLKYSDVLMNFINNIHDYNSKITNIFFHSSNKDYINENHSGILITYLANNIKTFSYCGVIEKYYFSINKNKVLESLNHNSCLHKKISIDKYGNIKNCPSMMESFGNIKDTTLNEALNHPNFKKYWNITKDQIDVCKDCEFRHICTDCRAYIEDPNNDYSKPLKCGYSPYTNEWEEWSTNPLKQKAIEHYGLHNLVKKDA